MARKKKKKVDPLVALNKLQTLSHTLDSLGKVLFHLDNLGIFFAGYYAAEGKTKRKIIGGIKAVTGLSLAKAPSLAVGTAGLGWVVATFVKADTKAMLEEVQVPGYIPTAEEMKETMEWWTYR